MDLTDWIVLLAIALMAIAFFCKRTGRRATTAERARHARGTRMLIQAAIALWSALFMLERTLVSPGSLPIGHLNPHAALAVVLALAVAGCLWSIRGRSLLKPRRIFAC
ncbi:hypothetical protein [Paraburkholderia oxyphila]|uniref:hypothetical protein n=1 Tax=Paraburkholderia oxyphila TaxID=614212 RepID=UPI00047FAA4F|nr:hypothetical protein [Paraburkholderia oxyphila]